MRRALLVAAAVAVTTTASHAAAAGQWGVTAGATARGFAAAAALPGAPTATSSCGVVSLSVKVSWTAVARASSYTLYRSSSSANGPFTVVATGIAATTYTDSGLYVATFWYQVSATSGTKWQGPNSASTAGRSLTAVLCT